MAVVSVSQIGPGRSGEGRDDYNRSYQVPFQVIVDDPYDGVATVGNAAGIPARYAPYIGYDNTGDLFALCTSLSVEQDGEEWRKWKVTATFETRFSNEENQPNQNPEEDPPKRYVEIEYKTRKTTKEWDGTDITNFAGQLINGIEVEDAVVSLCWKRNEIGITSKLLSHNNTVNSNAQFGASAGQLRLRINVGEPQYRNGVQFYEHIYKATYNKAGWHVNPANKGALVKGTDGNLKRPEDTDGQPIDGEVLLDNNGALANPADPIVFIGEKKLLEPKNWNDLNLTW